MNQRTYDEGYERSAHLYDLFDQKDNIDFFFAYASQAGEIIDVGAGTGRIAIPLAERGVSVFCVEPSPSMRRELRKKLSQRLDIAGSVRVFEGDASSFQLHRTFPAAFLSGIFDHFLDDDERLASLANIGRHLQPEGKLVFDVMLGLVKNSPLSPAGAVTVGDVEYRRSVSSTLLSPGRMEVSLLFEIEKGGVLVGRIEERSLVGVIGRDRLRGLLQKAGFQVRREFGSYDFAPFEDGDSLLLVEAIKGAGPS